MKPLFFLCFVIIANTVFAQQINQDYDAQLVQKLKADERGMRNYILVILKTGAADSVITNSTTRDSLFQSHFDNIKRLAGLGKLIVAGPLEKNRLKYRGIFILTASTFDEAQTLLSGDATIANHIFEPEFFNWYGSAALPEYLEADKKLHRYK